MQQYPGAERRLKQDLDALDAEGQRSSGRVSTVKIVKINVLMPSTANNTFSAEVN